MVNVQAESGLLQPNTWIERMWPMAAAAECTDGKAGRELSSQP